MLRAIDGPIEPLDVPGQQRLFCTDAEPEHLLQQALQRDGPRRQRQPAQVPERAVDDGVGAEVVEPLIHVSEQSLQLTEARYMPQRNMQDLVGQEPRLLRQRQR